MGHRSPMELKRKQGRDQGEMGQQQKDDEDLMRLLPDDAVADVLRRLGPRDLAASRCVSKAWCGIIDARRLMLPHEVGGIFIDFNNLHSWEFFARPTTGPKISGEFDFLPSGAESYILDHCNGLVLSHDCVFNPATRRWTALPPRPPQPASESLYFSQSEYLVFDPTVSPHFEVFIIPRIIYKKKPGDYGYRPSRDKLDPEIEQSEWPPSPWILHVFTSRTGQWEERSFVRDGEPAGTVNDMRKAYPWTHKHYAAYSQGELYVHWPSRFTARLSLSNNRCQIIKPPANTTSGTSSGLYLGKSEKGVYCAFTDNLEKSCWLWVWIIKELCGCMEWVLLHQSNLGPILAGQKTDTTTKRSWILQDINHRRRYHKKDNSKAVLQENFEWDSDNDDVLQAEEGVVDEYYEFIDFLGFHPYKEVVFLSESFQRGLAYHLNDSKVQYLGSVYPNNYGSIAGQHQLIWESFPYTPCWMGEYPPRK